MLASLDGSRTVELVVRRTAGVRPGAAHERPLGSDDPFLAADRLLVQDGGGQIPAHPIRLDPFTFEAPAPLHFSAHRRSSLQNPVRERAAPLGPASAGPNRHLRLRYEGAATYAESAIVLGRSLKSTMAQIR